MSLARGIKPVKVTLSPTGFLLARLIIMYDNSFIYTMAATCLFQFGSLNIQRITHKLCLLVILIRHCDPTCKCILRLIITYAYILNTIVVSQIHLHHPQKLNGCGVSMIKVGSSVGNLL